MPGRRDSAYVDAWLALATTETLVRRTLDRKLAEAGSAVTAVEFAVLCALDETGQGLTMAVLGRHVGLSAAGCGRAVRRLESHSFVRQDRTSSDRRLVRVALRADGRVALNRARRVVIAYVATLLDQPAA